MELNGYVVVDAFVTLVRLGLSVLILAGSCSALWRSGSGLRSEHKTKWENQIYFLVLSASVLVVTTLIAWPLFYVTLQSFVPTHPSAMCIEGVTKIGRFSVGPGRYLPGLVRVVELTRPVVVLLAGTWLSVWLINRRTTFAPLTRRALVLLLALGIVGAIDSSAEAAWLGISKREDRLPAGCCSFNASFLPSGSFDETLNRISPMNWHAAFFGGIALVAAGAWRSRGQDGSRASKWGTVALTVMTALLLAIAVTFAVHVAAPTLLRLPYHRCVYCLFNRVPETLITAGLFIGGCFGIWWGTATVALGRTSETASEADHTASRFFTAAFWALIASATMLVVELALVS